jgi:hypothetical protein
MFKILSTYICLKKYIKCNIWRVEERPSHIEDARFLNVNSAFKGLSRCELTASSNQCTTPGGRGSDTH